MLTISKRVRGAPRSRVYGAQGSSEKEKSVEDQEKWEMSPRSRMRAGAEAAL